MPSLIANHYPLVVFIFLPFLLVSHGSSLGLFTQT